MQDDGDDGLQDDGCGGVLLGVGWRLEVLKCLIKHVNC